MSDVITFSASIAINAYIWHLLPGAWYPPLVIGFIAGLALPYFCDRIIAKRNRR